MANRMKPRQISGWTIFTLLFSCFLMCALKIAAGTRATMLGYQIAELKRRESSLYEQRNMHEIAVATLSNRMQLLSLAEESKKTPSQFAQR